MEHSSLINFNVQSDRDNSYINAQQDESRQNKRLNINQNSIAIDIPQNKPENQQSQSQVNNGQLLQNQGQELLHPNVQSKDGNYGEATQDTIINDIFDKFAEYFSKQRLFQHFVDLLWKNLYSIKDQYYQDSTIDESSELSQQSQDISNTFIEQNQ